MTRVIATAAELATAFDSALNAGDLEGLVELLADDVASRTPEGAVLTGRDDVGANLAGMIAARAVLHNAPRQVIEAGDVALMLVDWTLEIDTSSAGRVRSTGTTANVARRDASGSWRLAVLNPGGTN